jgi:hypothetical protein
MNAPSGRLVGRGRLIAMRLAAEGYRNGINGHTRFQDTVPAFECCELGRQGVWTRDKTAEHVAVVPRNKEAWRAVSFYRDSERVEVMQSRAFTSEFSKVKVF